MKKFSIVQKNTPKTTKIVKENSENEQKEVQNTPKESKSEVSTFFSKLFESKEMAHIFHLQLKNEEGSYSQHMALGEYYEEVVDIIDEIVEVYQGQYDIVEGYDIIDTSTTSKTEPLTYMQELGEFILENRNCINERDTHILSLVDDLLNLLYRTVYKLKFLK